MSTIAPVYSPSSGPTPDEVLQALERVTHSRHLRESQQMQSFLEFVVRETLAGRREGLKEYLIGCQVFGRKADYDPRHDGIVRVQATTLRKRLERFYAEEGASDAIVIELPRGGYVPAFRYAAVPAVTPAVEVPTAVAPPRTFSWQWAATVVFAAIAAAAITWSMSRTSQQPHRLTSAQASDCPQLWSAFFAKGAQNLVGFGVPLFFSSGGLYIRDVKVNAAGNEDQGRIREFARKFDLSPVPTDDIYTGIGEAVSTNLLSSFFTAAGVPTRVASARMIADSELAGHNLVVVSSLRFQTLLRDLHLPSAFEFVGSMPEVIRNSQPLPGERAEYAFTTGAGISTSYALVTLWPGIEAGRRILSIGGVHTWATQAATEWVLTSENLRTLSQELNRDASSGAHGPVSPYFQILLRVEGRGNQRLKVEYVTHHYLPQDAKIRLP